MRPPPTSASDPAALGLAQKWFDMLFLHWRVPADLLRCQVPAELTIDQLDGDAWVSLVLFKMKVRPAWLPFLPGFSNLVEVNLRTYVRYQERPGITFLSVHAHNRLAMFLAHRLTPMPYEWAAMDYRQERRNFQFSGSGCPADGFRMSLRFRPNSAAAPTRDDTLDAWLLERYRLYLADRRQRLLRADVCHPRWQVAGVDVAVAENTVGARFGLDLARSADLAHFSEGVQARFGAFQMVP